MHHRGSMAKSGKGSNKETTQSLTLKTSRAMVHQVRDEDDPEHSRGATIASLCLLGPSTREEPLASRDDRSRGPARNHAETSQTMSSSRHVVACNRRRLLQDDPWHDHQKQSFSKLEVSVRSSFSEVYQTRNGVVSQHGA